ncbi:Phosphoglycerate dehydrogenase [Lutibacter agarilyticus]|uniref:Phosphoglycerate dehydrogenase n=1 Tax=Lutibacter agarilyticus TaxID=1109740 RepID=A0A238VVD8_9FLAO|nr:Phosphoglycerate dehydrogenase [Lutibacter agarilyticus]
MKVLLIDTNHNVLQEGLEKLGCICEPDYTSTKVIIEEKISNYDGIVIRSRFNIDKTFIDKATQLKFIARVGAGLESIDVSYAEQKGIHLISAPEGNRNAVGEHALGMILSLFNNLKKADLEIRAGKWLREANRGIELEGKTVGLIGYGNMGKAFAKKLKGFDVEVICYDIKEGVGDENCRQVSLEELQEKTDVLSLHTPFNELSYNMVNTEFIQSFKKPFYLINTARGSAVVTNHLVDALINKKVLGACLDVLEYEKLSFENLFENNTLPKAFEYLIHAENVLLSPHIAGWTVESHIKLAQTIVDKVEAIFYSKKEKHPETPKRVTGIGGLFFKTDNPKALKDWYKKHLNFNTDDWGCTFWWKDSNGKDASTQWSPFKSDTSYFSPSKKDYMFNYRVENLEQLLINLKEEGVTIVGEMETYEYGKFGWILDSEGNKIELWEPIDTTFL